MIRAAASSSAASNSVASSSTSRNTLPSVFEADENADTIELCPEPVTPLKSLGRVSSTVKCGWCKKDVKTRIVYEIGSHAILTSVCLFLIFTVIPIWMIPLRDKKFHDVHHKCTKCHYCCQVVYA